MRLSIGRVSIMVLLSPVGGFGQGFPVVDELHRIPAERAAVDQHVFLAVHVPAAKVPGGQDAPGEDGDGH